jgi:DNA polymerase-3 subunit epsilon
MYSRYTQKQYTNKDERKTKCGEEWTGTGSADGICGRVIEVAAIRVEGGKIVQSFSSLVDPETELPYFITNLTGITTNDLKGAPTFSQIADELEEILQGAVFVAHNVRFDYSFLKQEFKRLNRNFLPRQLCTVRLSRALFPEHRSHKLQSLIERYSFTYQKRHRAYDDAEVLWQFIKYIQVNVAEEIVEAAIAKQLRQPAIPKNIDQALVKDLPTGPGVYVFEDENGLPLYVGKSINIKKRVLQHFGRDHEDSKEFKISQAVRHIAAHTTAGELSALLLESRMVKDLQPVYNRQLRRIQKLVVVRLIPNEQGYLQASLEEASAETMLGDPTLVAAYPRRGRAKDSLEEMLRQYNLCPKLLGLEKSSGACFWQQLGKCSGACAGRESAEQYNLRTQMAFGGRRVQAWPFNGPVLVQESEQGGIVVDDWCVLAELSLQEDCEPEIVAHPKSFDLDTYKILQSFLLDKLSKLRVRVLDQAQLNQLGLTQR